MPMELVILGVVVLLVYLGVRLAATGLQKISGARHRAYRQLAIKYQGRFENRGMVDPPTVSFGHGGSSVRVGMAPLVAGQPSSPRTRVVARFARGLPFRLELIPITRPAPSQPPRGTRPVRLGLVEFDRHFVVQANDPAMAGEFLNQEPVRKALWQLRQLAPPSGMLLSINPERMLVQVDRNLAPHAGLLDSAVREAMILHDGLLQGVAARLSEGISIVAAGPAEAEDAGPPTCKVCGEPIVVAHVVCVACRTPCHRDCWSFVGGCSIFGCQGKQGLPA